MVSGITVVSGVPVVPPGGGPELALVPGTPLPPELTSAPLEPVDPVALTADGSSSDRTVHPASNSARTGPAEIEDVRSDMSFKTCSLG
ncbi:hypothetical protein [Nannocystis bainbridge]|uniref:Uncharacterized protein n=1 Tax=Nannocystis bainbridge TaxID=2995303 RepID=A0ABT5EDU5_9BACT|nr:hypothetical protein [Nannocystis bainbridge]MDC0723613.1 hypothetical protein [Nannocystis bainbridge]